VRQTLVVILLVATACTSYARLPSTTRDPLVQARVSVLLEVECGHGTEWIAVHARSSGSGGMVDARHVLTAAHVVRNCPVPPQIHATTADGRQFRVQVVRQWWPQDIALLELSSGGTVADVPPPALGSPTLGEELWLEYASPTRGRGHGIVDQVGVGVSYEDGSERKAVRVRFDAHPGCSGGFVYDRQGRLVGLAIATPKGERGAFFITRLDRRNLP
jgi:S1-C subfamily serine protease